MAKTNSAIQAYFDLLLTNAAWANVGDAPGIQPSATAGSLFFSFHTAWPGNTGNQTTNEAAYAGYGTRPGVTRAGGSWTVATPQADNSAQITFPVCTAGSETEMFIGIGTAATGAGNLLYSGPITSAFFGCTGATTNDITIPGSAFVVDQRIAFFQINSDIALPGNVTEGQVYYVLTAVGEVVTISASSGGAVVAISSSGAAVCCRVVPFLISANDTPALAAAQAVLIER